MGRKLAVPAELPMTESQKVVLQKIVSRYSTGQQMSKRANILLLASQGHPHAGIKDKIGVALNTVKAWRKRWGEFYIELGEITDETKLESIILLFLKDLPRPGTPSKFTLAQNKQIVSLACDKPINHGIEMTDWTLEMLALTAQSKGIVNSISKSQVRLILKNTAPPTT